MSARSFSRCVITAEHGPNRMPMLVTRFSGLTSRQAAMCACLNIPVPYTAFLPPPPCTHFAVSGSQWWASKSEGDLIEALSVVDACLRLVIVCQPFWWALENPVGRLNRWLGDPAMYFDPYEFGDPYTKKTALWGRFNTALPRSPVERVEGSKMWSQYGGKSERTKTMRSMTPAGFAKAFFLANP